MLALPAQTVNDLETTLMATEPTAETAPIDSDPFSWALPFLEEVFRQQWPLLVALVVLGVAYARINVDDEYLPVDTQPDPPPKGRHRTPEEPPTIHPSETSPAQDELAKVIFLKPRRNDACDQAAPKSHSRRSRPGAADTE